jgi:Fe-S-cluster-containing dehydrogenase component
MIGALKKREFGIVTWDPGRCIGCRYCQVACPYQIPKFEWGSANPKIVKCELCNHLLEGGGQPGCCAACPVEAVIYGKYTDLLADAHARIERHPDRYWGPDGTPKVFGETDGGGTQVLYLAGMDFANLGLPELGDESAGALASKVQHGVYKGFIAPVALYAVLGAVIWRNRRSESSGEED